MILDAASLLPGLLPASFRGIGFFVPDATTEAGRRVAEHLFPGVDRAGYDDMGLSPAVISIDGLMVGDDYVAQARALQAAFERPGPGTLMHPWLGGMSVILEEPGSISFSAAELRVARFSASFKRVGAGGGVSIVSTAARLLSSVISFSAAVLSMASAPGIVTLSQVQSLATTRSWRVVRSAWTSTGPTGSLAIGSSTAPSSPAAFTVRLAELSAAISASIPAIVPAVSPAAEAFPVVRIDPRQALENCLAAAVILADAETPAEPDRAMLLGSAGEALATAARLSAYVEHSSRNDAAELRNRMATQLSDYAAMCDALHTTGFAAVASDAARAALDLRTHLVADLNEVIGRLPAVVVFEAERDTDAFLLAGNLYGDRPETIEAGYQSLVARNRPRHPARLPAGRIEALK